MVRRTETPASDETKSGPALTSALRASLTTRSRRSSCQRAAGPLSKSEQMSRVRSKNTTQELLLRHALTMAGVHYRLHRQDLPGTPDVYIPRLRLALFVNGCFWHGHSCSRGRGARTNATFWAAKIAANQKRDDAAVAALRSHDIDALTVWQCESAMFTAIAADIGNRYRSRTRD